MFGKESEKKNWDRHWSQSNENEFKELRWMKMTRIEPTEPKEKGSIHHPFEEKKTIQMANLRRGEKKLRTAKEEGPGLGKPTTETETAKTPARKPKPENATKMKDIFVSRTHMEMRFTGSANLSFWKLKMLNLPQ